MRDRERRHDDDQLANAAERNDQTEQEQQMVGAAQDVAEALGHEQPDRLEPARIEPDKTGIVVKFQSAFGAIRRRRIGARSAP